MNSFVVVSRKAPLVGRGGANHGNLVLVSFARCAIWKTYDQLKREGQDIPTCWDKATATKALKDYANKDQYIVMDSDIIIKEFDAYKKLSIGSNWISRTVWGDVDDICVTPDSEKKVIFTLVNIVDGSIHYTITYDGNPEPKKIHTDTIEQFLIDHKPKKNLVDSK